MEVDMPCLLRLFPKVFFFFFFFFFFSVFFYGNILKCL
jgi:hypothetical protein